MKLTFKDNEIIAVFGSDKNIVENFINSHFSNFIDYSLLKNMVGYESFLIQSSYNNDNDKNRIKKVVQFNKNIQNDAAIIILKNILESRIKTQKFSVISNLDINKLKELSNLSDKHKVEFSVIIINNNDNKDFVKNSKRLKNLISKTHIKKIEIQPKELFDVEIEFLRNDLIIDIGNGLDIMGDGHGLLKSRLDLIEKAGYVVCDDGIYRHPSGRKLVYLNDETGKGCEPDDRVEYGKYPSIAMANMMMKQVKAGEAYAVDSNHNYKLWRFLEGRNVIMQNGDELVEQEFINFEKEYGKEKTLQLKSELLDFLKNLPSHLIIQDNGINRAVVVHAGIKEEMIGKKSNEIRDYCRFGPKNDESENIEEIPNRIDWTKEYNGAPLIIWGHDPRPEPRIINNTINLDQGGYCGHKLTLMRYPDMEFVHVNVNKSYVEDEKNAIMKFYNNRFEIPSINSYINGINLEIDGKEINCHHKDVAYALDLVSTRTVSLEELFYVAPTMSPTPKVSKLDNFLEHPNEAFEYFIENDIKKVVAQKKHMGSRALITLFKNEEIGKKYINKNKKGFILSRNNIRFFNIEQEKQYVDRLVEDLTKHNFFEKYDTDLLILDCEILPWNLKANSLITNQYGLVSNTSRYVRNHKLEILKELFNQGKVSKEDVEKQINLLENSKKFHDVFSFYCWNIEDINNVKIAPFHILSFSKESNFNRNHEWHMGISKELSMMSSLFIETPYMIINLDNEQEKNSCIKWWKEITEDGHEGIVIKPYKFISKNKNGEIVQPAIKVRGKEYLRIIYGMDYLEKENLEIIKQRSAHKKMKKAISQFLLSVESINRFINMDKIENILECVLASMSIDNEFTDPRL
jgi:hypothetical protein